MSLMLSYIQINFLYLRLVLFCASIWFILWGWLILDIALDLIIWNAVFALINIILAIPLFLSWLPVRLNKEESAIYEQHFKSFFTKKHFKILFKYATLETIYAPTELAVTGNQINKFIFIHFVSQNSEASLFAKGKKIASLGNGSWVGVIDANSALNQQRENIKWDIDCRVVKATDNYYINVIYFPVDKLKTKVFKNKKYGRWIEQSLEAMWLEYN